MQYTKDLRFVITDAIISVFLIFDIVFYTLLSDLN